MHKIREANYYNSIESAIALLISFIINLFVVSVFAQTFFENPNAGDIGLSNSAEVLGKAYGEVAKYIWAVGMISNVLALTKRDRFVGSWPKFDHDRNLRWPVCNGRYLNFTSTFTELTGFIQFKMAPWKRVLITRSVAIVPAIAVAVSATDSMDVLNEWLNVLQSIQLPFALIPGTPGWLIIVYI